MPSKPKTDKEKFAEASKKLADADEFIKAQNDMIDSMAKGKAIHDGRVQEAAVKIHEAKLERNKAQNDLHKALGQIEKLEKENHNVKTKLKESYARLLHQKKVNIRLRRMLQSEEIDLIREVSSSQDKLLKITRAMLTEVNKLELTLVEHNQEVNTKLKED